MRRGRRPQGLERREAEKALEMRAPAADLALLGFSARAYGPKNAGWSAPRTIQCGAPGLTRALWRPREGRDPSESQTPVAAPKKHKRGRRERRQNQKLGHLRHTGSRRKGPGVGPVLGPRHEELADRVELRAQHVRAGVSITTSFPSRPQETPSPRACGRPRNKPKAAAASRAARGPGPTPHVPEKCTGSTDPRRSAKKVVHRAPGRRGCEPPTLELVPSFY